jgi:hypothetical protein
MALVPAAQEIIPQNANVVARGKTTPLFGLGLIEAIPDATIKANAASVVAPAPHLQPAKTSSAMRVIPIL